MCGLFWMCSVLTIPGMPGSHTSLNDVATERAITSTYVVTDVPATDSSFLCSFLTASLQLPHSFLAASLQRQERSIYLPPPRLLATQYHTVHTLIPQLSEGSGPLSLILAVRPRVIRCK